MKSRVVLIASPGKTSFSMGYPLGISYISAVLKNNGNDVSIYDFSSYAYPVDRFINEIKEKNPDFVGLTVFTYYYNEAKKMISLLRRAIPRAKIVIGGPHVSALPVYSLVGLNADFGIVGEGEYAFLDIIRTIESNCHNFDNIAGIVYWKDNKPILNSGCNLIRNLDELPFPAWDLLSFSKYEDITGQVFFKAKPIAPLLTSRGCPHLCSFCASHVIHGRNLRRRSFLNVVDEVEFLIKNYGVKEININDDTFSEIQDHALSICKEIIKRKLRISWRASAGMRADTLNEELLRVFKASGCYSLSLGIESFNDKVLLKARKPLLKSQLKDKIRMVREFGIEVVGFFILGLPEDTENSIRETIYFAKNSQLDFPIFSQAVPLPGSDIFNQKYSQEDLIKFDWDSFDFNTNFPFGISEVAPAKLKKLYSVAYLSCYLVPRRILRIVTYFLYKRKIKILKLIKTGYYILRNLL